MAIEAERLLAIFEAKFTALEKALAKAPKDAKKAFGEIEAAGTQAENTLATIGSRGTPSIDRLSKSIKGTSIQTSNLAAQFNDIGVQLAGGQAPFLIALQQGTQITQALGPTGARGAVTALGGAFVSMLNPVSLATIAVIGLGGAAIQYFTSAEEAGDGVNKTLKDQADLLSRVASAWGDQLPGVQELAKKLKDIADANERAAATGFTVSEAYKGPQEQLAALDSLAKQVYSQLNAARLPEEDVKKFSSAWNNLQEAIKDNSAEASDAKRVIDSLTQFSGMSMVDAMTEKMLALANSLALAAQKAREVNNENSRIDQRNNPLGRRFRQERGVPELPEDGPSPDRRVDPYFDDPARSAGGGSRKPREDEYKRATDAIVARTAALVAETEAQRQINPLVDDYGFAAERARMERELLTAAEEAGKEITPQLRDQIASLAEQYALAGAESARLAQDQRELQRAMEDMERLGENVLGGFISDLMQGRSAADALSGALAQVGDKLLDIAMNSLFDGGGGGFLSGLFGGGKNFFPAAPVAPLPFLAKGTNNFRGGLAVVGEKGPELVNLPRGSQVTPNNMLKSMPTMEQMRGAGGSAYSVDARTTINAPNSDAAGLARLEAMVRQRDAELPSRIIQNVRDAQKRRLL